MLTVYGHVPTDFVSGGFSARNQAAVPSVGVKRFGAELTILHVVTCRMQQCPTGGGRLVHDHLADRLRMRGKIALDSFLARDFSGDQ